MTHLVEQILEETAQATDASLACFERLPTPALLLAKDACIVAANPAAHRLLGAQSGVLSGRSAAHHFPGLWSGDGRQSTELDEADPPRRVIARRMDGQTCAVRLRFASIEWRGAPGLIVTAEDLTEFEDALAESAAAVVAANREYEKFIDVAAHDLRAPLRILTGFADALEDEAEAVLTGDAATFLKEIRVASTRMEGILDGLLSLARSSRAEMNCESLDLTTLVELISFELRHSEPEREVEWQIEPELKGWGDVRLMMTALRALIGNAWKFTMRTAGAAIHFQSEIRDGRVWFCIRDNGAGFDMAHAGRLFKPFTRLHRQDEFPGHGLGLATAAVIVRRHGGHIEAEAAPGSGATIRFCLADRPE